LYVIPVNAPENGNKEECNEDEVGILPEEEVEPTDGEKE